MIRIFLLALAFLPSPHAADLVWSWVGGVDHASCRIVGKAAGPLSLRVATDWSAAGGQVSAVITPDADGLVRAELLGLAADTAYSWGVDGSAHSYGRFRTLPEPARPASFSFAFGSCSRSPDGPVFAAIADQQPLFFLCTGDLHYRDINEDAPARFMEAISSRPASTGWGGQLKTVPLVYMWDDHDYGGNGSDGHSPAAPAAHAVYRRIVPHHPLALPGPRDPIAQSFSVGRVRFVIPDLRSARNLREGSILGDAQRTWIEQEVASAPRAHRLLVLVSSVPWNGQPKEGSDRWQSYDAERTWLADLIKKAGIRACVLAGDAHMVAIDDGTNSDFARGWPMPIFQAGALDKSGSYKGGRYSHGANQGTQQFGVMSVHDEGKALQVRWEARMVTEGAGVTIPTASRNHKDKEVPPQPIALTFTIE